MFLLYLLLHIQIFLFWDHFTSFWSDWESVYLNSLKCSFSLFFLKKLFPILIGHKQEWVKSLSSVDRGMHWKQLFFIVWDFRASILMSISYTTHKYIFLIFSTITEILIEKFFTHIFSQLLCKNAILHFLQLNFLDLSYHIMTRFIHLLCVACYFHLGRFMSRSSNLRRTWPGRQTLSSSPPTASPKWQLFAEQLSMRMTWRLAENIYHQKYKEGTTTRGVGDAI